MEFPESVLEICNAAAAKFPDVRQGVKWANREVRKLPDYDEFIDRLVFGAVEGGVYDSRHKLNTAMRFAAGGYGGPAKVVSGGCEAVNRIAVAVYSCRIAGTMLGLLTGKQLPAIAETESAMASGYEFNAALCRRLAKVVPEDKQVRDAVSEKKLRAIFQEISSKASGETRVVTESFDARRPKTKRRREAAVE